MKRNLHMKMQNVMVWVVLMVCICFAAVSHQASAIQVGPDVIDRTYVDIANQITFIDPGHAIPAVGEITAWHLWAENIGDVKLQVFRPIGADYQLIGQNVVSIDTIGRRQKTQ